MTEETLISSWVSSRQHTHGGVIVFVGNTVRHAVMEGECFQEISLHLAAAD